MKFVGADGDKVGIKLVNVCKWLFSKYLHRIRVKNDAPVTANRSDFIHRLNRADLVVGSHHRNEDCIGPNCRFNRCHRDSSCVIDRQISDFEALLIRKIFTTVQNGVMLDRTGDYVASFNAKVARRSEDRQVIAFSSATRENDLARLAFADLRHPFSRIVQERPRASADVMHARRIAVNLAEERDHNFPDPWIQGSGRIVIKINTRHRSNVEMDRPRNKSQNGRARPALA
jgi:hypothetical protein